MRIFSVRSALFTGVLALLGVPVFAVAQDRSADRDRPLRLRPTAVLRPSEDRPAGEEPAEEEGAAEEDIRLPIVPPAPRFPLPYGGPGYGLPYASTPYAPAGLPYYAGRHPVDRRLGRHHHGTTFDAARQAYRYRQDALEARRAVEARRRQRAESGRDQVIERPGPYPYNPGPINPAGGSYGAYGPYSGSYSDGFRYYDDPWYYGTQLESYRTEALAAREELTLMAYEDMLTQGVMSFRAGQYGAAARSFIAAADKHHGDSGSRIHAAQALVAVGMYADALEFVRRAVSLKPLLLYTPINLQADYGIKEDFAKHVAALEAACKQRPDNTDNWLLLAFVHLFSTHPERSKEAVLQIQKIVPYDRFARRLTQAAKPIIAEQKP